MDTDPHEGTNSGSLIERLSYALVIIAPSLLLLYYIHAFGVNVVYWDEWGMVPLLEKMKSGTLSFSDLFQQYNEHRIFFPRLVILGLGELTRYDTVAEMLLSWIFIVLACSLIFLLYRKGPRSIGASKLALAFLPVSFMFFSFRQSESILWGFTSIQLYLTILCVVASLFFLRAAEKSKVWLVVSGLSAVLASFSSLTGLMVWPSGLVLMWASEKRKLLSSVMPWCVLGALTCVAYLYGFVKPVYHPPLDYALMHPSVAAIYFGVLMGAPFSYDVISALSFGVALALVGMLVLFQAYKAGILRENRVWLSLIIFVLLSLTITTVGRSGFGVQQAVVSRYTPITGLGIVGLYFLAASVSEKLPHTGKRLGFHALLALFLVGLMIAYSGGWIAGQNTKNDREMGAYILATYKIQSDENIEGYLYPSPAILREQARFLEQQKLNVFSEPSIDASQLIPNHSTTLFALDTVNGKTLSQPNSSVTIHTSQEGTFTIIGWAVDSAANRAASAVFITIDGKMDIPTLYGLDRQDVATAFNNPNFRFSGFIATFSSSTFTSGQHVISFKVATQDGLHYYNAQQVLYLVVD